MLAATTLHMVAADPEYAASLAARLGASPTPDDDEALMRQYLQFWADDLISELRNPTLLSHLQPMNMPGRGPVLT